MTYAAPTQTISQIQPGFGSPAAPAFQSLNVTVAAGATTTTNIPSSGVLTFNGSNVTLSKGYIRVRLSNNGAAATVAITVTATDGTLITQLFQSPTSTSTTNIYDFVIPFFSELLLNKFTIAVTTVGGGGTFTGDYEISGTQ